MTEQRREVLTEVIPLRMSPSMKRDLEAESIKLGLKRATYIRQIIDRRHGSK